MVIRVVVKYVVVINNVAIRVVEIHDLGNCTESFCMHSELCISVSSYLYFSVRS